MNGSIRIPILEQDYRPSFTPQNYVDAVQVSDPRGAALQGLGKSIGEVGEAIRENQKKESKPAEADHPAIAKQTGENNKAWTVDAFAQCTQEAAGLTQKVTGIGGPANASTDAALTSAAAGEPLSKFYLDPMAIAKLPSPVQAAVAGLMPGSGAGAAPGAGAGDPNLPDPASLTDPAVHGTTGAWINGYDLIADKAIAAAPTPQTADDLIKQCTTARQSGISRVLRFEADANLAKRQETVQRAAQNVGASRLRQDPAALPGVLAFFEAHKLDVGLDKQKAFDAQWRGALVDAAVQGQMERDPKGLLLTLENRRSRQDLEGRETKPGSNGGTPAANEDAIDPLGAHLAEHPLASALTPEEVARYLPQVRAGVYTAESNQRAALAQQAQAATQSYLATGKADGAPDESAFITSFGLEEGRQRFAQLQQAREEGSLRQQLLALPDHELERMWGEGTPAGGAPPGLLHDLVDRDHPDTPRAPNPDMMNDLVDRQAGAPRAQAGPALLHDLVDRRAGLPGTQPAGLLQRLITEQRRQRAADPIEAAQKAGGYGVQALPFTQAALDDGSFAAALQDRAQSAPLIAGDYRVPPALLSQAETRQLATLLQGQSPAQQEGLLKQITDAAGNADLADSALRGLSAIDPVLALAGWHQRREGGDQAAPDEGMPTGVQNQWGGDGKLDVVKLLLGGNASLNPTAPGAKPPAMPPMQELWHSFGELTGNRYANLPGAEAMQFAGVCAIYAAQCQKDGDSSGELNPARMQSSVYLADDGSMTPRQAGLLMPTMNVPGIGMPSMGGIKGGAQAEEVAASATNQSAPPPPKLAPRGGPADWNRALPGLAPLSKEDAQKVDAQATAFGSAVNDLLTKPFEPMDRSEKNPTAQALSTGAIAEIRKAGEALRDPKLGEMMAQQGFNILLGRDGGRHEISRPLSLDEMDKEVEKAGLETKRIWKVIRSLADVIATGDPSSQEAAQAIGVGMHYIANLPGGGANVGPTLLLGLLGMQGKAPEAIEKIITASQLKSDQTPNYVWHEASKQPFDVVMQILTEAGMRGLTHAVDKAAPVVSQGARAIKDAVTGGPGGMPPPGGAFALEAGAGGIGSAAAARTTPSGTQSPGSTPPQQPPVMAMGGSGAENDPNVKNGSVTSPTGERDVASKNQGQNRIKEEEENYRRAPYSKSDVSIRKNKTTGDWDIYAKFEGEEHPVGTAYINKEGGVEFAFENRHRTSADERIKLKYDQGSFTELALTEILSLYKKEFGKLPPALPASITDKNLKNFQDEFAKIRIANPNISNQEAGDLAVRRISYGKARIELGYGKLTITFLKLDKDGVPVRVHANALPTR